MKKVKTLALVALLLSLIYLGVAVFCFYQYHQVIKLFAHYGITDAEQMTIESIAQTRHRLSSGFKEFTIAGLLTFNVGIGLYRAKEWARKTWLGLISLLMLFHVLRLIMGYQLGTLILMERIIEVLLISLFALLSWRLLTDKAIKSVFFGKE